MPSKHSLKVAREWYDDSSLAEFADFSDDQGYEKHLVKSLAALLDRELQGQHEATIDACQEALKQAAIISPSAKIEVANLLFKVVRSLPAHRIIRTPARRRR